MYFMDEYVSLHQLPRELKTLVGTGSPGYQSLYRKIVDGRLPATRTPAGRWMIARDDLPVIMAALGLTAREASDD
jgi:hypothetical protein